MIQVERKRQKKEEPQPRKFLGGVLRDMELAKEVDWQKHRQEILDRLENEEIARHRKMEKAKKLHKSWELNKECRRILQELNKNWVKLEDKIEEQRAKERKEIQLSKAMEKKRKYKEKQDMKDKNKKITDMFKTIPKTEARKIEDALRNEENREHWRTVVAHIRRSSVIK